MKSWTTAVLISACVLYGQDHQAQTDHHAGVNQRGDQVMGFSHEKTTHHFRLYTDGGAIEVNANDSKDTDSRDQIQMHLGHIAQMFAEGNFRAPMLIHDQTPPGVPTLQKLKKEIAWRFEKTAKGGRVRATTANDEARGALHEFLRFQISDHQTGDSVTVTAGPK
jgi:hypothetical protein